jgi:tetratricopeptide (TPR) repeat protein
MWSHGYVAPQSAVPQLKTLLARALALDDALAEARAISGLVRAGYDWDFAAAESELQQAIAQSPNSPTIRDWYALYLKAMGRHDEAIAENTRALDLDPLSLWLSATLAWAYYYDRRCSQALEQCSKALEMDPAFGVTHWTAGVCYLASKEYADAVTSLERAAHLTGSPHILATLGHAYAVAGRRNDAELVIASLQQSRSYVPPYPIAIVYTGLGDRDAAFDWLEQALDKRDFWMIYLNTYPIFDSLRDDSRFHDLVCRVGLKLSPHY